jgi:hypothetical protein
MSNPEESADLIEKQDSEADEIKPYPLREPSEDPKWAVRTVRIWIGISFAFLTFILILGIFGLFYD